MKADKSLARFRLVFLIVGILLSYGCGEGHPPTYPVTGQVVFPNGTTLKNGGQVVFRSTNLTPPVKATGLFGPDGKFELTTFSKGDGAVAAHYQVAVLPTIPEDHEDKIVSSREYAEAMDPIDSRFKNSRASKIEFDVSADTSPHDFKIEVTKPRRRR